MKKSAFQEMQEILKPASNKNGHPITQNDFDSIEKALRDIVEQYESMPDGYIGRGLTNGIFWSGRRALNKIDEIEEDEE